MMKSIYTPMSGAIAQERVLDIVANNLANANAKGFKRDRAEFEDLLSSDLSTSSGGGQLGRGARLKSIRTMHVQGGLAVTDNLTDLAIQGQGFFVISNNKTEVQESAGKFFTRVGSFVFDKDGYLADSAGGHVEGYMTTRNGNLSTKLQDIRIETNSIAPKKTEKVTMDLNLDSRVKPPY
jgi:flagellar hook protein FlgE